MPQFDIRECAPATDWSKIPTYDHYPQHKISSPETPENCCDGGKCHAPIEPAHVPPGVEVVTSRAVVLESLPYGSDAFKDVLAELWGLHCRKGFDYGTVADSLANIRAAKAHGVEPYRYAMLRADEKMTRYKSFLAKGSLRNEPLEETLLDLASQAILALVLLRE